MQQNNLVAQAGNISDQDSNVQKTYANSAKQEDLEVAPSKESQPSELAYSSMALAKHEQPQSSVEGASGQSAKPKGKAYGQTGPKTVAGKNRSRWNALKDGATAKSSVLPFEDERLYRKHVDGVQEALAPTNYVENTLVRDYADATWRIIRHEKRDAYERERIFDRLTGPMVAQMLGLEEHYINCAPDYLKDLKYKISKKETDRARQALVQYCHLMDNAKHIGNFNMVWRQYPLLFEALSDWMVIKNPGSTPIFSSTGKDLNLAWQKNSKLLVQILERFSDYLFYVAHFESFKPQIRVWMESWYFLQRNEIRKIEHGEQLLLKERNYANNTLDKIARLRKSALFALPVVDTTSVKGEFELAKK